MLVWGVSRIGAYILFFVSFSSFFGFSNRMPNIIPIILPREQGVFKPNCLLQLAIPAGQATSVETCPLRALCGSRGVVMFYKALL